MLYTEEKSNYINNIDKEWQILKTALRNLAEPVLTEEKSKEKQERMTDKILHLTENRRVARGKTNKSYIRKLG